MINNPETLNPMVFVWLAPLIIWGVTWKGIGLWKAAQNKSKGWFIAMFLLNTVGILPIIYIYFVHPEHTDNNKPADKK